MEHGGIGRNGLHDGVFNGFMDNIVIKTQAPRFYHIQSAT